MAGGRVAVYCEVSPSPSHGYVPFSIDGGMVEKGVGSMLRAHTPLPLKEETEDQVRADFTLNSYGKRIINISCNDT